MPSSPSPLLRIELQTIGENLNTWGDRLNAALRRLEEGIADVVTITITGATYTLSSSNYVADEARGAVLIVQGTLTANTAIQPPTVKKLYLVINHTAQAGFSLTIKTAGGTGVALRPGAQWVYCDGTDYASGTPRMDQVPAPTSAVDMNNQRITGLGTPTASTDAATRGYVDSMAFAALAGVLPGQASNAGKFLTTDGTTASWAALPLSSLDSRISAEESLSARLLSTTATLQYNLAITVLRQQIDTGWSVLRMVSGIADEFEDETGISAKSGIDYDATNDFYFLSLTVYSADLTSPGGTAAWSGSTGAANPGNAFDNNTGTTSNLDGDQVPRILYYDFGAGNAKTIRRWTHRQGAGSRFVTTLTPVYSDNGTSWTDVGSAQSLTASAGAVDTFNTADVGAHRYWGVRYTAPPTGGSTFSNATAELEFMELGVASSGTLTSISYTASAAPTEVRVVLLSEPVSSVTLNTDVTLSVSRDGGATWTAGTLVNQAAFDATTNILTATVDVSGQPSGTAVRWKIDFANSKNQRVHGVWLQWR